MVAGQLLRTLGGDQVHSTSSVCWLGIGVRERNQFATENARRRLSTLNPLVARSSLLRLEIRIRRWSSADRDLQFLRNCCFYLEQPTDLETVKLSSSSAAGSIENRHGGGDLGIPVPLGEDRISSPTLRIVNRRIAVLNDVCKCIMRGGEASRVPRISPGGWTAGRHPAGIRPMVHSKCTVTELSRYNCNRKEITHRPKHYCLKQTERYRALPSVRTHIYMIHILVAISVAREDMNHLKKRNKALMMNLYGTKRCLQEIKSELDCTESRIKKFYSEIRSLKRPFRSLWIVGLYPNYTNLSCHENSI